MRTIFSLLYIQMETFPKEINLKTCMQEIKKNQSTLILQTRKEFCEQINEAVKLCKCTVTLEYPVCLWAENRILIARELFERFGTINVRIGGQFPTTISIKDPEVIPKGISSITIELFNVFAD